MGRTPFGSSVKLGDIARVMDGRWRVIKTQRIDESSKGPTEGIVQSIKGTGYESLMRSQSSRRAAPAQYGGMPPPRTDRAEEKHKTISWAKATAKPKAIEPPKPMGADYYRSLIG